MSTKPGTGHADQPAPAFGGVSYAETFLLTDHLGSAIGGADGSGVVQWREGYRPFGDIRTEPAENVNNTGFTGHLKDSASGLVYMQARYYDPLIGRFYSTDPIGYEDQLNLYAYVANDPVNAVDPNGEETCYLAGCSGQGSYKQLTSQQHRTPGVITVGVTRSQMITDNRGRRSVVQGTIGAAIGLGEGKITGATLFSSAEYGIGLEKGVGLFVGGYTGDPSNFEGAFSTTGGQGYNGLFGGSVTAADGLSGGQFNIGAPGGSSTVGYTKTFLSIGNAFQNAQDKVGATFSDQNVSYSANKDGSVSATISSAGSRITRELTCTEDGCK